MTSLVLIAQRLRQQTKILCGNRIYSEIDPLIKNLINAMAQWEGITTVASCQGHGWTGKPPYVYFKAPANTAAKFERLLREDSMAPEPQLTATWTLVGRFDEGYEMTYLLHSPELDERAYDPVKAAWFFWLHRHEIDRDLLALVGIWEQTILPQIGDSNKPKISTSDGRHG